jgi:hypothetical protein
MQGAGQTETNRYITVPRFLGQAIDYPVKLPVAAMTPALTLGDTFYHMSGSASTFFRGMEKIILGQRFLRFCQEFPVDADVLVGLTGHKECTYC